MHCGQVKMMGSIRSGLSGWRRQLSPPRFRGLTLVRSRQRPRTLASTDRLTDAVDVIQYRTGEGPCLSASEGDSVAVVDDLAVDPRWPAFGTACAAETGVRSVVSIGLSLSGEDRAALNLYAFAREAFDDLDVATASILGPYAALAVEGALRREDEVQFTAALGTSRQIGRAVGIVMARELVTEQRAFAMLQAASQRLNRKLRDVAVEVELTGSLPAGGRPDLPTTPAGGSSRSSV